MRSKFDAPHDGFHFEAQDLSSESIAVVKKRMARFAAELNELVEIDATVPAKKRVTLGVLLACRPWSISIVHALRGENGAAKKVART